MDYAHWDLGQQSRGSVVQVSLTGSAANVRLLDSSNFGSFHAGQSHTAVGGHYTRSPAILQVPSSGHWHVVVDYGGLPGRGRASVQVLRGQLAS
jgi:hypothetical protein